MAFKITVKNNLLPRVITAILHGICYQLVKTTIKIQEETMTLKKYVDATENLAVFYNSANGHYAISALKYFPMNSIVQVFRAKEQIQQPTYLSVQIDEHKHIHLFPEVLQYTNHSCEPNTFFDTQKGEIIAVRNIHENEEITFFYPATEWAMTQPFKCFCNTRSCLGMIQGAAHLDSNVIINYRFSDYIQKKLYQCSKV
jgi:hypothetical protein